MSTQPTPTQANLPADLKLTQESFNSIISLSDDLNLNELECARQWHNATKMDIIAQVSMLSGRSAHEVEKNPVETAKYNFTHISNCIHLMGSANYLHRSIGLSSSLRDRNFSPQPHTCLKHVTTLTTCNLISMP